MAHMRDVSVILLRCCDHWQCSDLNSIVVEVDVVAAASFIFRALEILIDFKCLTWQIPTNALAGNVSLDKEHWLLPFS